MLGTSTLIYFVAAKAFIFLDQIPWVFPFPVTTMSTICNSRSYTIFELKQKEAAKNKTLLSGVILNAFSSSEFFGENSNKMLSLPPEVPIVVPGKKNNLELSWLQMCSRSRAAAGPCSRLSVMYGMCLGFSRLMLGPSHALVKMCSSAKSSNWKFGN